MKKYHSAGCVVLKPVEEKYQVLCLEYMYSHVKRGWVLPKGGVEEGETEKEAAIRETNEETGLEDIIVLDKLGDYSFEFYDDPDIGSGHKTISWFLAISESYKMGQVSHEEHEHERIIQISWIDLDEAKSSMLHMSDVDYLVKAEEKFALI